MASLSNSFTLLLAAAAGAIAPVAAGPAALDAGDALAARSDLRLPSTPSVARRGSGQAPNGYTPEYVDCPRERPTIHKGNRLSPEELEWLPKRRNETIKPIRDLLKRINIPDFDSDAYLRDVQDNADALPNIGIAISGGGYRAMLCGAGALAAWDDRSDGATDEGNLGGLLQSATYVAGLSGGSWLVGSLWMNNFTSVQESVNYPGIWQLENSILSGPDQYSLLGYYSDVFGAVGDKDDAGFERSITDYWGRMLSYQLINATDGGPGYTFSSIADDEDFKSGKAPMPLIVAVGRNPDEDVIALNSTVFEFNPWYLGSFDPTLNGFAPLKYVGSKFNNGKIPSSEQCVRGFDNAGFVMGTSSSLFNAIVLYINEPDSDYVPEGVPDVAVEALSSVLETIGNNNNDIADWTPNPFFGWNEDENLTADKERLTLVDGGEDLQNVPYHPLIANDRDIDVIFSFDASADTDNGWPDGASIIATYERSLEDISKGTAFPAVPGKDTFMNLGLNTRPTFFGCNATNTTEPTPLVVYIPNYPYVYHSNISTFSRSVSSEELSAIIQNGYVVTTQLNATVDKDWPVCVGCAMLSRSFDRTNTSVPAKCAQCFESYCWNGTLDESTPEPYDPQYKSNTQIKTEDNLAHKVLGSSFATAVLAAAVGLTLAL